MHNSFLWSYECISVTFVNVIQVACFTTLCLNKRKTVKRIKKCFRSFNSQFFSVVMIYVLLWMEWLINKKVRLDVCVLTCCSYIFYFCLGCVLVSANAKLLFGLSVSDLLSDKLCFCLRTILHIRPPFKPLHDFIPWCVSILSLYVLESGFSPFNF